MIENIINDYTPFLVNGTIRCFEEKDVISMLMKVLKSHGVIEYKELLDNHIVEQYPESGC